MTKGGTVKRRRIIVRRGATPPVPPAVDPGFNIPPEFVELMTDESKYIQNLLMIRDKRGTVVPFALNPVQQRIMEVRRQLRAAGKRIRLLVLKSRRQGVTTLEQGLSFKGVASEPNYQALTLAHNDKSTEKIFRIANLFYELLDERFRPRRLTSSNKRDLNFPGLRSLYSIGTAGGRGVGRGETLNRAHWSETSWSPGSKEEQRELLAGLTEAASAGEVVLETTPNGVGDLFHEKFVEAMRGGNEWLGLFFPWWADPTYREHCKAEEAAYIMANLTEEEASLVNRHGLDAQQIKWRRAQMRELGRLFQQEYPEDWETCFLVSGQSFFEKSIINDLFLSTGEPIEERWNGELRIWKKVEAGRRYIIAADVAEGIKGGNWSTAGVLDAESGEQVAALRGHYPPEEFARRLVLIAQEYKGENHEYPLLAVERNNHGHSCLNTLANVYQYPNLYYHREYDARGKEAPVLGWPTTPKTRPIMLDDLREAVEKRYMIVHDRVFLDECRTFGPNDRGKYEALNDADDDTIFAWGIGWQIRQQSVRRGEASLSGGYEAAVQAAQSGKVFTASPEPISIGSLNQMPGRLF